MDVRWKWKSWTNGKSNFKMGFRFLHFPDFLISLFKAPQEHLEKVICMERTKDLLERILRDGCVRIWLPTNPRLIHDHVVNVVNCLLQGNPCRLFKLGIAVDPPHRFNDASYAYCRPETQLHDGVRYEGMVVVYMNPFRDAVSVAEVFGINYFLKQPEYRGRCANRKRDLDDNFQVDQSDEDRPDAPGPHSLYIVWGERGPCSRSR